MSWHLSFGRGLGSLHAGMAFVHFTLLVVGFHAGWR